MSKTAIEQGSGNVFADLGLADATGHRAKAELVRKLAAVMKEAGLNQSATARLVGVSQPDISRLLSGRFRDVSIERLLTMLQRLDCDVAISVEHHGRKVGEAVRLEHAA
jgi:predicted XRE-type DNA-binding protein